MAISLVTAYPFWFILFCFAAGTGYAAILYYKNTGNGFSRTTAWVLAVLRTLAVAIIAILLLSPLLKTTVRHSEKPVVILAMDNSGSILVGKDSAWYRKEFTPAFQKLADELNGKYEVRTYSYSEKTEPGLKGTFNGKQTNIGDLFNEIRTRYTNRNLAALILAGDGIVTRGADPLYSAEKVPYSIYTVAMGDTAQHKDMLVARVNYNRLAYLGNSFPVEITLMGYKCAGSKCKLSLSSGNKQLYSEEIAVTSENFTKTVNVNLTATTPGVQRYHISISALPGEVSLSNNVKDVFVEVLDGRQKILLLSAAPHPDIAAIKQAIEHNQNYEVEETLLSDFTGNISKYNLVILHQVPSLNDAGSQLLTQIKTSQVPVLYILGSQSNLAAFNALQAGLIIPPSGATATEAYPLLNAHFSQFAVSNEVARMVQEFPPLSAPFGQYKAVTSADPLLYQRIGSVSTTIPLIVLNQGTEHRSGIIAGEGIWRWRLANYLKAGNQQAFDELFSKIVQFLAVKLDKSQFRVLSKNYFFENEAVELDAELYNDSYELVNEPDVNISIIDKEGKSYPFTFTRTLNSYYLNASSFPPGEYTYKAVTIYGGKTFPKTGAFAVMALNEETMNTVADHSLLHTLAKQHNGEMVYPAQLEKIKDLLEKRNDIKTVSYSRKKYTDLVNIFGVFLLILSLLSAEWFIRKRNGGY